MNNFTTKIAIWGAAAAIAFGGFTVVAQAQGPGGGRGPGGGPGGMLGGMIGHMLDLTDAQKEQIKAIARAAFDANQTLATQLKAAHETEQAAIKAGKPDAELAQLAQSYAPLHTQLHAARLQTEAKIYKVLTPEQRTKLDSVRSKMRDNVGGAMQRFGHHRGGPAAAQE
jgi:Spy/CpxP family protein refolding chaperone